MSDDEDDFDSLMDMLDDEAPIIERDEDEDDDEDFSDLAEFDAPDDEPEEEVAPAAPEPQQLDRDRPNVRASALISVPATKTSEAIRRPLMSGHCHFPQSRNPDESHLRCQKNGGGSRANPDKVFQPCPCLCHYPAERYECGNCGGTLLAAPHYPLDEDGDIHYVHLDTKRNRATDGECGR